MSVSDIPKINNIFPFLWLRDEADEKIQLELEKIRECGINSVCVESRPYTREDSDFFSEKWFSRIDFIIKTARKLDMQLWILDDKFFPTGSANHSIRDKYPHLRPYKVRVRYIDAYGENKDTRFLTGLNKNDNEQLLGAFYATRQNKGIAENSITPIPFEDKHCDFIKTFLPYGEKRVILLIKTQGAFAQDNYIDMLCSESTDKLVDEVYEPYYARFKDEFGKTIVGFFSDEPCFQNGYSYHQLSHRIHTYYNCVGQQGGAYPFSEQCMQEVFQNDAQKILSLFFDTANCEELRCQYMDFVTKQYSKNFNEKLSKWCNERNVAYASHIIEDMGTHTRLGHGAGHFFKAMQGADFSGIDIVLHQIKPYENSISHIAPVSSLLVSPLFFNYTLCKLASSDAHFDPKKNGRALCEIFGAYGHGETITEMKWLLDHTLVRGINYFIPHAFSMNQFDGDCPPHFYCEGVNPSYDAYKILFRYMADMGKLFDDGRQEADVLVLYHAEAEWSGKNFMPVDTVAKTLAENQIEFHIAPIEVINRATFENGKIIINNNSYHALVVPDFSFLPQHMIDSLNSFEGKIINLSKKLELANAQKLSLSNLGIYIKHKNYNNIRLIKSDQFLRAMHYIKNGKDYYMLFNEGIRSIKNKLILPKADYVFMDVLYNTNYDAPYHDDGVEFTLNRNESVIITQGKSDITKINYRIKDKLTEFDIYTKAHDESEFQFFKQTFNVGQFDITDSHPSFSGFVKYSCSISLKVDDVIQIHYQGELLSVKINDKRHDFITSPAMIDADECGECTLDIIINNTLASAKKDYFSQFCSIDSPKIMSVNIIKINEQE